MLTILESSSTRSPGPARMCNEEEHGRRISCPDTPHGTFTRTLRKPLHIAHCTMKHSSNEQRPTTHCGRNWHGCTRTFSPMTRRWQRGSHRGREKFRGMSHCCRMIGRKTKLGQGYRKTWPTSNFQLPRNFQYSKSNDWNL